MNKQEVINKINGMTVETFFSGTLFVKQKEVIKLIEQLDEPEKIKVPQFVAEHIKHAKEIGRDLQDAMNSSSIHKEVDEWLYTDNNMELFARAWLDGYTIEEKRYMVTLKNGQPLVKSQSGSTLYFSQDITAGNYKVTREELEEVDFGEVFNSPLFEVEEVE